MSNSSLKDNYFSIVDNNGKSELNVLSFKFKNFRSWIIKRPAYYTIFTVTKLTENMLDLISYQNYQTENYWWILATANNILDPINQIKLGTELIIPSLQGINTFINQIDDTSLQNRVIEI